LELLHPFRLFSVNIFENRSFYTLYRKSVLCFSITVHLASRMLQISNEYETWCADKS